MIALSPAPALGQLPWPTELVAADRATSRRSGTAGIADALLPVLADDAILLYPGIPLVRSRRNVEIALRALPAQSTRIQWDAIFVERATDGRLAVMYGTTLVRVHPDSAARQGRFLSAWRMDAAGAWKLEALALIGAMPADSATYARIPIRRLEPVSRDNPFAAADLDFAHRAHSGVADAFEAFAAPDAALIGPTDPFARGPGGIRDALVRNGSASLTWSWRPVYVLGDGTVGVTLGEAEIGSQSSTFYSQYMTLWRRNADGSVKYIADGGAGRPAPR